MDDFKEAVAELRTEIKALQVEMKETRHDLNNKIQELYLTMERDLAKRNEVYSRGELDRVFDAITNNSAAVKDLLKMHGEQDEKHFGEIREEIKGMREEQNSSKDSLTDKLYSLAVQLLIFILGAGLSWIVAAKK